MRATTQFQHGGSGHFHADGGDRAARLITRVRGGTGLPALLPMLPMLPMLPIEWNFSNCIDRVPHFGQCSTRRGGAKPGDGE